MSIDDFNKFSRPILGANFSRTDLWVGYTVYQIWRGHRPTIDT